MIKILEEYFEDDNDYDNDNNKQIKNIIVKINSKEDTHFERYPITLMPTEVQSLSCVVEKRPIPISSGNEKVISKLGGAKEKALELKDSVVNSTR